MIRLLPAKVACIVLLAIGIQSCDRDDDNGVSTVKRWTVEIKSIYEVPAPANRNEEGEATIELLSDNSLKFNIHIHNLSPSDALTNAHIHIGDAAGGHVLPHFPEPAHLDTRQKPRSHAQLQLDGHCRSRGGGWHLALVLLRAADEAAARSGDGPVPRERHRPRAWTLEICDFRIAGRHCF